MKITIECDRQIKKLNIEFTDGDGEFEEPEFEIHTKTSKHKEPKAHKSKEKLLSLDDEPLPEVEQEILEKPQIEDTHREPLVAGEMQNLEF